MSKTIYVPQGYSARLISASSSYNINGLYTDGFSTCNIIACIGNDKAFLAHVDTQSANLLSKITDEIEWVGENSEIIYVSRHEGKIIKDTLLPLIRNKFPLRRIMDQVINAQQDGIYISPKKLVQHDQSGIHPNIKIFDGNHQQELELIHHPQESQFLTVQKIEQIIGMRARYETKKTRVKYNSIFDGYGWEPLGDNELTIVADHTYTEKEMATFHRNDTLSEISQKMHGIVMEIVKIGIPFLDTIEKHALEAARYMETYLNHNNYIFLLKKNLEAMINNKSYPPRSQKDSIFKQRFHQALKTPSDPLDNIEALINSYENQKSLTPYIKDIINQSHIFINHYRERKYYASIEEKNLEIASRVKALSKQAIKAYSKKNYQEAQNLFFKAIQESVVFCLKDNPDLATLYYNFGRSLYQSAEYKDSEYFLNMSLVLKEHYTNPKPEQKDIEKNRKALEECKVRLQDQRYYIKATINGAVRLDNNVTPQDISGLYTDGLETCIALIITSGERNYPTRISLIHDNGHLSIDSILKEFAWVTNNNQKKGIKLYMVYNPKYDKIYKDTGKNYTNLDRKFGTRLVEIRKDLAILAIPLTEDNGFIRKAKQGFVFIDRNGDINLSSHIREDRIIQPSHHLERKAIHDLNYYFLGEDETISIDLQYDSIRHTTGKPPIYKSIKDMMQILHSESISTDHKKQRFFQSFTNTPDLLSYFKDLAAQQKVYSYTIPSLNNIKKELILNTLEGIIISEGQGFTNIMINSDHLKKEIRDKLNIDRCRVTLDFDKEAQLKALKNNKLITIEATQDENKFLVTFPKDQHKYIENIVNKWKGRAVQDNGSFTWQSREEAKRRADLPIARGK